MLARQRQAFILDRVREDGAVRVADLVRELGVSDMTVRRDLEILDERGLLEKVHGGATSIAGNALFELGFAAKSAASSSSEDAIADAAVALAEPGMAVAVSAGRRPTRPAQRLADVPGLTVVTNSIRVADVLHQVGRPDQTIILTGGVRTPSAAAGRAVRGRRAADRPRRPRLRRCRAAWTSVPASPVQTCSRPTRTGRSSSRPTPRRWWPTVEVGSHRDQLDRPPRTRRTSS